MASLPEISVVVPVFNEEDSLPVLYRELREVLDATGRRFEIVFVDDHSTDASLRTMLALRAEDPRVRVVQFRRNFGQTAALAAGFEHARGRIVITLDGDLQNDPADIPALVAKIEEGYDVVAGWRRLRQDDFLFRKLPSRLANRLIAYVTDTPIHDTGCTLKAFRSHVVKKMSLYAEQHRFLPAMSRGSGALVAEIVVNHRPRRFGRSKYGLERAVRVLLDLFVIKLISQFAHRPLHYFGLFALPFAMISMLILFTGTFNFHTGKMVVDWPQMVVSAFMLFFLNGTYFLMLGLLAELAVTASGMHRRRVLERFVTDVRRGSAS